MKNIYKILLLSILTISYIPISNLLISNKYVQSNYPLLSLPKAERLAYFHQYNIDRTKDPVTGEIPLGIREKVLNFVSQIPSREEWNNSHFSKSKFGEFTPGIFEWESVGPTNIGGRMNCVEVDIANEKIILSGAASGGVWRSIDFGKSWIKSTAPNDIQSVYCIAQDRRVGKTNNWYYGTGELLTTVDRKIVNSARMSYPGNGIFKSTDNGLSWFPLKSTQSETVGQLKEYFQGVWKIIPDLTDNSKDVVFAACLGGIMKSLDGGESWNLVLGDEQNKSFATDLQMAENGTLYASLSRISINGKIPQFNGIYRSTNKGESWENITPESFQTNSKVIKLTLSPESNNILFALVDYPRNNSFDPYAFQNTSLALWKATNLKTNLQWENATSSIAPPSQEVMSPATLGGYAMVIKVKPDNDDFVFIGGTSLYRSQNSFLDNSRYDMIGGYYWNDGSFGYDLSAEYVHPDIHDICFLPSNPDKVLVASDGGIHYSENIRHLVPTWTQKNDGLITSQFYSVSLGKKIGSKNYLLGGLQDNGSFALENKIASKKWTEISGGDGMQVGIARDMSFIITSWYNGGLILSKLDDETFETTEIYYASPQNVPSNKYTFYNNYILDPVDNNSIYLPAKNIIFYNHSLDLINETQSYQDSWVTEPPEAFVFPSNENVTAMKIAESNPDILFVGTNVGRAYMIENINTPNSSTRNEITGNNFPKNSWVSCIDYDEQNEIIILTFSNYNIQSIFYSEDFGETWFTAGGNLEENPDGSGAGPSVRWVKSVNLSAEKTFYFLGTDAGIFSTDNLNGINTIWLQEGKNTIGNVIVEMIDSYKNELVIATQGAGIFTASLPTSEKSIHFTSSNLGQNYPNPSKLSSTIEFYLKKSQNISLEIYDVNGNKVQNLMHGFVDQGSHKIEFSTKYLNVGTYFYSLITPEEKITKKLIIQR